MKKKIQTPAYQNLFNQYELFIKAKGYRAGRKNIFQTPIKEFLIWMESKGITDSKQITTQAMKSYYEYLIERPSQRGGTLAGKTIKIHLFSISLFSENLLQSGILEKAFLIPRHGAENQSDRSYLTVDEIKELYRHAESGLETALLALAYGCGLRRTELERLTTGDVQLSQGMVIVRNGKGDKRREVPMSDKTVKDVKEYITGYRYQMVMGKAAQNAFFVNQRGKPIKGNTLNKTLKKLIERTQNAQLIDKEISLHSLRHSIANHLMENNASIEFIRGFLGHSFINTAYIYALKNKRRLKPFQDPNRKTAYEENYT